MADLTDAELDRLVRYLQTAPSMAARNAAAAITTLRARIAEDQAQIAALTTYRENLRDEVIELRARIAELEARLEIDPAHPYDGIAARDATIEGLQGQIAELEADRAEWVEVERLRMGKATPPAPPA